MTKKSSTKRAGLGGVLDRPLLPKGEQGHLEYKVRNEKGDIVGFGTAIIHPNHDKTAQKRLDAGRAHLADLKRRLAELEEWIERG
jgi:hypothetical protein